MPYISHLSIQNLRNIETLDIQTSRYLNIVTGENGAGKTSILEAISYLSNGRSFRTNKYKNIIQEGSDQVVLRGKIEQDDGEQSTVGLLRTKTGDFKIKQNSEVVNSAAELAKKLPLLVLDSNSFGFFDGSPKERRKLFDWLVFHVKHSFQEHWVSLLKCYKQRNSLLRSDKIRYSDLEPWDRQIARVSWDVAQYREEIFGLLKNVFLSKALELSPDLQGELSVEYNQGWKEHPQSCDHIMSLLQASFERDKQLGYSTLGPHKADIKVKVKNKVVHEILSRGQQKKLVSALYLSLIEVLHETLGKSTVLLADDLPAEFDCDSLGRVISALCRHDQQCFITAIDRQTVENAIPESVKGYAMFHVKHGVVDVTQAC